jgi:hypothetical protein
MGLPTPDPEIDHLAKEMEDAHIVGDLGDLAELRTEFKLLSGWKATEDGHTDDESEGYDGFGRQMLCDIIEVNWKYAMNDVLRDPKKGIDIHPNIAPTRASELSEWRKRLCEKRGESIAAYLERLNDAPKNPLDFGFPILSHLALISEWTVDQGESMLEALNEAVQARKARYGAKKTNDLLVEDIKKVINDLIEAAEAEMDQAQAGRDQAEAEMDQAEAEMEPENDKVHVDETTD